MAGDHHAGRRRAAAGEADRPGPAHEQVARRYLLARLLRCGHCGATLVARPRADGTRRYVCATGPNFSGCGKITIVADSLEALVVESVLYRFDSPELAATLDGQQQTDAQGIEWQREAERAQGQLEELARAHGEELIGLSEWLAARTPIEQRFQTARRKLAGLNRNAALAEYVGDGAEAARRMARPDADEAGGDRRGCARPCDRQPGQAGSEPARPVPGDPCLAGLTPCRPGQRVGAHAGRDPAPEGAGAPDTGVSLRHAESGRPGSGPTPSTDPTRNAADTGTQPSTVPRLAVRGGPVPLDPLTLRWPPTSWLRGGAGWQQGGDGGEDGRVGDLDGQVLVQAGALDPGAGLGC